MHVRADGRTPDQMRPVAFTRGFIAHAEGSVLVEFGQTRVLCTVTVEDRVPHFLRGKGHGWLSAEYGMLPRATPERTQREASRGRLSGRTMEIQRLIGRAVRAAVDLKALGERTLVLDCDVIQADGGTRTAAITGCFVAVADALGALRRTGTLPALPLHGFLAAVSVGLVAGVPMLDLAYSEDSRAEVDMNVIMDGAGDLVEVQAAGEAGPFPRHQFDALLALAESGVAHLVAAQQAALGPLGEEVAALAAARAARGNPQPWQAGGVPLPAPGPGH